MRNINNKINKWPQEWIKKFISYVRCKGEDRQFFKKYNLNYVDPDWDMVTEILYERITKNEKMTKYFFSHVDRLLSLNPEY